MVAGRSHRAAFLCIAVACCTGTAAGQGPSVWTTRAEYRFGDAPEKGVFFSWPYVVADPGRNRVFALEAASSQVSVWTPEGSLLFVVGRKGEGPGEFVSPGDLFVEADGAFSVQEAGRSRYTYFTADGELLRTVQGPGSVLGWRGLGLELHRPDEDGVHLGVPRLPADLEVGTTDMQAVARQPVLRVGGSGSGAWDEPEVLLWLDRRNRTHLMRLADGGELYAAQPFGDPDQVRFEPGRAVVMRLDDIPGAVELLEVSAEGDTIWHRRLRFQPRRVTPAMVAEAADAMIDRLAPTVPETPRAKLREIYVEGLYRPEFVPPVEGPPILTSSGEVWLRSTERSDTFRVHHAVRRGTASGNLRRVLLPERLWIGDVTPTHVWGVVPDSLDIPHIVGRRLVRVLLRSGAVPARAHPG